MKLSSLLLISFLCVSCKWGDSGQDITKKSTENAPILDSKTTSSNNALDILNNSLEIEDTIKNDEIGYIDTLSILTLKGDQYENSNYEILRVFNSENKERSIVIFRNKKMLSVASLPSFEDVKNFSVSSIAKTNNGFSLKVNWGGGNNFYDIEFDFYLMNGEFELNKVIKKNYDHSKDKEHKITQEIKPPVPFGNFRIMEYLLN